MLDSSLYLAPQNYALLTDLYQLTMMRCYEGENLADRDASFELFVRRLPENYGYLIAMGLAAVIDYLQHLSFSSDHLQALAKTGIFDHEPTSFWERLANFRFTGNLWAVPEGTMVFPHQPILRIETSLFEGQLLETYLLNAINYQTMIATKTARIRDVAGDGVKLLEFGTRRAFSPQASLWAARSALAAGMDGTSNVLAALQLGRKPSGTMAHALVMAFAAFDRDEASAFRAFEKYFPGSAFLLDTFDTIAAAQALAQLSHPPQAIRIDSGDYLSLSQQVRAILPKTAIMVSGDMDEYTIDALTKQQASIDGYGIGTKLVTGTAVNGVYKLVEIDGIPVHKRSPGKHTYPGRKQIYRSVQNGKMEQDFLRQADQNSSEGHPLLVKVIDQGQLCYPRESLEEIANRVRKGVNSLPHKYRRIEFPDHYPVAISPQLQPESNFL